MAFQRQERTSIQGRLTDVDSAAKVPVLTRFRSENGKEYIYLAGAANVDAGDWVTYDEAGAVTLLAGNAVGQVGIAMAAIVANKFGWYQIYGVNTAAGTDTVAADKQLYIDATAGRADDAAVTGDLIVGAVSVTADNTNVTSVFLNYPMVTDVLG